MNPFARVAVFFATHSISVVLLAVFAGCIGVALWQAVQRPAP